MVTFANRSIRRLLPVKLSSGGAFELHNPGGRGFLCAVLKLRAFAKYWLPVVVWAAVIFSASGDKKSVQHSSRIIEPILRWLIPHISDEAVRTTVLVVRKGAHVTVYSVLALLLWRGLRVVTDNWGGREISLPP